MKKTQIFFAMMLFLSLTVLGQEAARRPMTTDDALNMVQLGDALISPDGERVFFSKSELNWEKNKRDMKFYMISSRGGEAYRYIGDEGGDSFQFFPRWKLFVVCAEHRRLRSNFYHENKWG